MYGEQSHLTPFSGKVINNLTGGFRYTAHGNDDIFGIFRSVIIE